MTVSASCVNVSCCGGFRPLNRLVWADSVNGARAVSSVTMTGNAYVQAGNHDPDGSSNGTVIKVNRP